MPWKGTSSIRPDSKSPAVFDAKAPEFVAHGIEPVFSEKSRVLILGTMPSPKSREAGFFYAHPRNRFWPVMERLFGLEDNSLPDTESRKRFLLEHDIALWDVLASCRIDGASDASIRDARPNDLARIIDVALIDHVFCTGSTAARLYRKLCEPQTAIPCVQLPSTSPANARMSLDSLTEAYRPIALALERTTMAKREEGGRG